ncbi:MAG TPA: ABC transporter ATP-binding protein [Alphaproteobacteria bacterium]|nr:ABC transporter ATP-binding protein [Alphaproteobacteria bacterium]
MLPPVIPRNPLSFLAHYMWRHRWAHGALLLAVLAAVIASVSARYSLKFLVDAVAAGPQHMAPVWSALTLFAALICTDYMCWRAGGWIAARTFPAVGADLRIDLFRHLLGHSARFFSERFAGALAGRITAAATAVYTIENALAWNALPPAVAIVGSLASVAMIHPTMAMVLAGVAAALAAVMAVGALRGQPLHAEYARRAAQSGGEIVDAVANHAAVRSFASAGRECDRLNRALGTEVAAHRRALYFIEKLRTGHALSVVLLTGGMLIWGVLLWQKGTLSAGDLVVIASFSVALLDASRDLVVAFVEMTHHWSKLGEAVQELTTPHELPDRPDARPLERKGGSIALEDLTFAYPDGRRILHNIKLRIPAGQKVAIVGPSGAGKTTLLALVQRLYPVVFGRILVDGQDISLMNQDSLRSAIAVVPQDVVLFHRSVLENVRYGRPDATDEEVAAAARAAHCADFIRQLPEGYDTIVGERGVRLSGGQRQRIGIARAILADAPIVLLDEATSALDTESELAIQHALAELMRGRTVLAVAHRLSTIARFDRVIVMNDGRIVEDGPPAELARRNGHFGRLWRMQTNTPAVSGLRSIAAGVGD